MEPPTRYPSPPEELPEDPFGLVHITPTEALPSPKPRSTAAKAGSRACPCPCPSEGLVGAGDFFEPLLGCFAVVSVAVLSAAMVRFLFSDGDDDDRVGLALPGGASGPAYGTLFLSHRPWHRAATPKWCLWGRASGQYYK